MHLIIDSLMIKCILLVILVGVFHTLANDHMVKTWEQRLNGPPSLTTKFMKAMSDIPNFDAQSWYLPWQTDFQLGIRDFHMTRPLMWGIASNDSSTIFIAVRTINKLSLSEVIEIEPLSWWESLLGTSYSSSTCTSGTSEHRSVLVLSERTDYANDNSWKTVANPNIWYTAAWNEYDYCSCGLRIASTYSWCCHWLLEGISVSLSIPHKLTSKDKVGISNLLQLFKTGQAESKPRLFSLKRDITFSLRHILI